MATLRPRLCVMDKSPGGYGFHLHGDKGRSGQFIRLVEADTPASAAGLLAGDRLMFVNGHNVEGESHQEVVARIRATSGPLMLIVADLETVERLQKLNLRCREEFVREGIPDPGRDSDSDRGDAEAGRSSPEPRENGDSSSEKLGRLSVSSSTKEEREGLRPRLCHLRKSASGYGFNLHSEKSRPGQFIRAVDDDSPAQRAGLRAQDKIIEVNGVCVVGMQHSEVVAAIKAGGDQTSMLVVDPDTEDFFKRCGVLPTEEHVTGRLPEPESARPSEEEAPAQRKASLSPSPSNASSSASLPAAARSSTPPPMERDPEPSDNLGPLGLSLAQARERVHQKRSAKKAPPMDWSKRNELFSNL